MKPIPLNLFVLFLLFGTNTSYAQEKCPVKFGKVSSSDFNLPGNLIDSNANAVVIADIGFSEIVVSATGDIGLNFTRKRRVKILNKNGFDAANVSMDLYVDGSKEEKLDKLKAVTYNLEGGKVTETKLDNKSIFKDVKTKNWTVKKFTFPAVQEGSIIEYSYTIYSEFLFNLQPWEFQGEYPCYWSEYEVEIPEFFNYVSLAQGYHNMQIRTSNRVNVGNYSKTVNRWVMKDVKPLKEENFTSTLQNHISKIEFQLSQVIYPNSPVRDVMGNWTKAHEELMKDEDFGFHLSKNNNWLDDELKRIKLASSDLNANIRNIYSYVRDNFTCTNYNGTRLRSPLKNIMKVKNGNVAELNLLLCAMLRHENIDANPVLLSTRAHGFTHTLYPLMNRFNYLICQVNEGDKTYYLDASRPNLGFAKLPVACYNGHARVFGATEALPVYFYADSLLEQKVTSVFIINGEKEGSMLGSYQCRDGYFESISIREKVKDKGQESFFKDVASSLDYLQLENQGIDSLHLKEEPVSVRYDFKMDIDEELIYFNPLMKEGYKENPFKSAERTYPVEMPYTFHEMYVFNMEVPAGYKVEEIPKSVRMMYNEGEGMFEYIIQKDDSRVQLRSLVYLKRANFLPEEYESLREFFGQVVKKHSEQVVFKKIKN